MRELAINLVSGLFIIILNIGLVNAQNEFVTTWKTNNAGTSDSTSISIQTFGSYTYNYDIDWNSDGTFDEFGITGGVTHDYGTAGTYTVSIRGTFPSMYFNNGADKEKLISIDQWGTIEWGTFENAFYGCKNMIYNATDTPDLSNVSSMKNAFLSCSDFDGDLSSWDVSNVSDFTSMFQRSGFNGNISTWDMSSAEKLFNMFYFTSFNQDISSWNVSNVTNMNSVFKNNSAFNQDLSSWDVSNVTTMSQMFKNCSNFNQDISTWDVSKVESMIEMFSSCYDFDQDLSTWQIDSAKYMTNMFEHVSLTQSNYDKILISWASQGPQSNVTFNGGNSNYCHAYSSKDVLINTYGWNITDNGENCDSTNYFISSWKTDTTGSSGDTEITIPTNSNYTYNYDVDWDNDGVFDETGLTGSVTHNFGTADEYTIAIRGIFPAIYFNNSGDKIKLLSIDHWGDISWKTFNNTFWGCSNMAINASGSPDLSHVANMDRTFQSCTSLSDEDLSLWDVSAITSMTYLFASSNFNGDISTWDVSNVSNLAGCFYFNFDFNSDISAWDVSSVTSLENTFYKAISFNQDISAWNVSNVQSLGRTFYRAGEFNQDLSAWDVSSVTSLSETFREASKFTSDLSQWNTSSVLNMSRTFQKAYLFNSDIGSWDVSNVTNMGSMFSDAYVFDQDLSNWNVANLQYGTAMLNGAGLSQENYDKLLMGWSDLSLQTGVSFDVGSANYCHGASSRQYMIDTYGWTINDAGESCDDTNYFVTKWLTTNTSGPFDRTEIIIPTNPSYTYLYDVDWDNNGVFDTLGITGDYTHDFGAEGEYTIQIRGKFPAIYFNNTGDKDKLISIEQWGNIHWKDMEAAFRGCGNMTYNATDAPDLSEVTSLELCFSGCTLFNGDISNWDVSNIETMWASFANAENFNQNIGNWDVSSVEDMVYMFLNATSFDQDLSAWDITKLGNAGAMFDGVTLSIDNYDALLEGWSQQAITQSIDFGAGNSQYCNSAAAKDTLEIKYGWIIDDGGLEAIAPTPDASSLADITSECEITSLVAPTASDNCTDTVFVSNNVTLPISTQGTTIVTWTYQDANGNTSTQTQNIIIEDVTAPMPNENNLADITAECEITALTKPSATDNCSDTVFVSNDASLPITTQGTTVVTWTYDDGHGNTSTQTQNIIIEDVTAPVADIASLDDITAECEVSTLANPSASDNCSDTVFVSNDASLPITTQGTTVVTWTYEDGHGNTSSQTQNIIIDDVTAPLPNESNLADITAECEITSLTAPTANDNCDGSITANHNISLPITTQGTTIVTWTYSDAKGNTSTQSQNVIVNDISAPVPDIASLDDINAINELTELTAPTATDNCTGEVLGTHNISLPITAGGTTIVTWTYDDGHGNTSTQTQNVIIDIDNEAPIADIGTLSDLEAECEITSLTAPTATDNFSGSIIGTHNASLPITSSTSIIWSYDDGNGNISSQTQDVIIEDITAPVADIASLVDITAECEVTSLTAPTATDNCEGTITGTNNATFPITSSTSITWTYTDGTGNASTQIQEVIINDITAPVADIASLDDITAECEITSLTAPTATDNCEGTITGTNNATLPITSSTSITWTYTDGSGNASTQVQDVIINDMTAPVADIASLVDITAECEVTSLTAPTATDNCDGTITGTNNATFPITSSTSITWTYTDGTGNASTQIQEIIINDITAPVADIASLNDITTECEITSLTAPTATDNCEGTITGTSNATFPITSSTSITWTYTDGNGNTSTQIQELIINDMTAPVADIASLEDITAECEITSLTAPTATDNCEGTITGTNNATFPITSSTSITWTYTDGTGNASTQVQEIIINDITAPVADIASLDDITTECEITSLTAPTATDNCEGTITGTSNATFPITSSTSITWTYTDGSGNTSTQIQELIIEDLSDPSITCIENLEIEISNGSYLVQGNEFDPTDFFDNCEIASLSNNINNLETLEGETFALGTHTIVWTVVDISGNSASCSFDVLIDLETGMHSVDASNIQIYPNPVTDFIEVKTQQKLKIEIYNNIGHIVKVASSQQKISMQDLPQGVYFIKVENSHEVYKIVKQ